MGNKFSRSSRRDDSHSSKREQEESREILSNFTSDTSRQGRITDWVQHYAEPPVHPYRETSVSYDYAAQAGPSNQSDTARYYYPPDLDAPSDTRLSRYEQKRDACILKAQEKFDRSVQDYRSRIYALNEKKYYTFEKRKATLNACYQEFVRDTKQMLSRQTIEMRKLCEGIGLPQNTNDAYFSTSEGDRFQFPNAPAYDEYNNLLL